MMAIPVVRILEDRLGCDEGDASRRQLRDTAALLSLDLVWGSNERQYAALIVYCDKPPEECPGSDFIVLVCHEATDVNCPHWASHMITGRGEKGLKWALRFVSAYFQSPFLPLTYGSWPSNKVWYTKSKCTAVADPRALPPVCFLVHGGFWSQSVACDHMAPLAAYLSTRGWACLNLEFRRGNSWTQSVDDIANAISAMVLLGSQIGFDIRRMVVIGHSSGAHLAHIAMTRLERRIDPALFVSLAGILSLTDVPLESTCAEAISLVNSRSISDLPDPAEHIIPASILAVHGTEDTTVPLDQAMRFRELYRGPTDLLVVNSCDHMDLLKPERDHWNEIIEMMFHAVSDGPG